jgi:O-antigen/teichoic acid export membrane protein
MDSGTSSDVPELSLARRSVRGAAWNYGGAVVVTVGQLAYTALTARLISPAEFGAYATAQALLALVGYFTLATVGNAIIRQPALDRRIVGTGIAMTAVAGAVVAVFVLAMAGVWADIWRSPGATTLLRLYAPQVLLAAFSIVPMGLLRRNLRFRTASLIETSSILIGFGVGAGLALQLRSAEALVMGQVASFAVLAALSAATTRSELAVAFGREEARSLFSFSAQVSLQNLGHYLNNILPSFAISRSLGQASLGFYSRGSLLVWLPLTFLVQGVTKTLYPIYPRFRSDEVECRRMLVDVASVTTMFVWPLFAALAGFAPLVVQLLLGSQWTPVAALVGPLCIYAGANFAYTILTSFAESFAYLRLIWLMQAAWTIVLVMGLGLAIVGGADTRTIVLVAAALQVAVHAFQIALLARTRSLDPAGTVRVELWAVAIAAVWYIGTMLTTQLLVDDGMAVRVAASCIVFAGLALGTFLVLPHLPAGKAFARRGIRVTLRPKLS